jgi:hypothetical protein
VREAAVAARSVAVEMEAEGGLAEGAKEVEGTVVSQGAGKEETRGKVQRGRVEEKLEGGWAVAPLEGAGSEGVLGMEGELATESAAGVAMVPGVSGMVAEVGTVRAIAAVATREVETVGAMAAAAMAEVGMVASKVMAREGAATGVAREAEATGAVARAVVETVRGLWGKEAEVEQDPERSGVVWVEAGRVAAAAAVEGKVEGAREGVARVAVASGEG